MLLLYQWEDSFLRKPLRHTCVLAWLAQQLCFLKYPGQTRSTFGIPLLDHHIFFPLGYKSSIISQVQGPSQCPTSLPFCRGELNLCIGSDLSLFSHLEALLHRVTRRIFPQNISSHVIFYLLSSSILQNLSPHLLPIFKSPVPKC